MSNTDEHIEQFEELGYSHEQAVELANNYIFYGSFDVNKNDFIFFNNFDLVNEYQLNDLNEYDNSGYEIGCDFKGLYGFEEFENDLYYIPSSYHCVIKCFEKILEYNRSIIPYSLPKIIKIDLEYFQNGSHQVINPYGISITKSKNIIYNYLSKYITNKNEIYKYIPEFYKYSKKLQRATIISNKKKVCIFNMCILLLFFNNKKHHAIIWKENSPKKKNLNKLKFKIIKNTILSDSQRKIAIPSYKNITNYKVIAYDIETYTETVNNKKMLIPYSLGYCYVNLYDKNITDVKILTISNKDESLFDIFIKQIYLESNNFHENKLYIYAHNGSKFDNLYSRCSKYINIISAVKKGNVFKNITATFNKSSGELSYIYFRDTLPFVLTNLNNACQAFKCNHNKLDFNIVNWSYNDYLINKHKKFINNQESDIGYTWEDYLKNDVTCLAELIIKINESLIYPGFKIIDHLGIPSVSWNLILKTCFNIKDIYLSTDPITLEFEKSSIYGGRVLRWKSIKENNNNKLISLDVNSLYPASMHKFKFPVGKRYVLTQNQLDLLNQYGISYFKNFNATNYIIEIIFQTSNIKYPIVPWKDDKGNILYQLGQLSGVYNDVDIQLMLNDGYQIIKIIRGIYFKNNKFIFKQLIEHLYNQRISLKEQNNHREYIYKTILNSMYGVMLLTIKDGVKYVKNIQHEITNNKNISGYKLLKNKQYEVYYKFNHDQIQHPLYIGGYILSYARKIMNYYIDTIGRENIWYSDTDSLYVDYDILNKTNLVLSDKLGGIKNDYGKDKFITEAYFVDLKRYLLIFNDNTYKQKCLGVNFKTATFINDFYKDQLIDYNIHSIKYFYKQLLINGSITFQVDKWFRNGSLQLDKNVLESNQIVIINNNIILDISNRDKRGFIINNSFTPIGFNNHIQEFIPNYKSITQNLYNEFYILENENENSFSCVNKKLYLNTPLVYTQRIKLKNTNLHTCYYIGKTTNNYYYSNDMITFYQLENKLGIDFNKQISPNEELQPLLSIKYDDQLAYNKPVTNEIIQKLLVILLN